MGCLAGGVLAQEEAQVGVGSKCGVVGNWEAVVRVGESMNGSEVSGE